MKIFGCHSQCCSSTLVVVVLVPGKCQPQRTTASKSTHRAGNLKSLVYHHHDHQVRFAINDNTTPAVEDSAYNFLTFHSLLAKEHSLFWVSVSSTIIPQRLNKSILFAVHLSSCSEETPVSSLPPSSAHGIFPIDFFCCCNCCIDKHVVPDGNDGIIIIIFFFFRSDNRRTPSDKSTVRT